MPGCNVFAPEYIRSIFVAAIALSTVAPALSAESPTAISNFARVGPHLYRGAAPAQSDVRRLHQIGVHTILDLRMHHDFREESEAKRLGMSWVHIPMGYFAPSDKKVQTLMSVLTNPSYGTIFVHCAQGADRTGEVVALYRIVVQDWPLDKVFAEMRAHHFKPWWLALKQRVETERERMDKAKASAQERLSQAPSDRRRLLLDNKTNVQVAQSAGSAQNDQD